MSTLVEIESAARGLSSEEKRKLLLSLAESLRAEGQELPAPRVFSIAEMQSWMEEDDRDGKRIRGSW